VQSFLCRSVSRHRATRLAWIPPNERVPPPDVAPQVVPNASQGDHPATAQEQAAVADESPCAPTTPYYPGSAYSKMPNLIMSFVTVASPVKARQSSEPSHYFVPSTDHEPESEAPSVPPPPPDPLVSQDPPAMSDSFPSSPAPPPISKDVIEKLATDAGSLPYRSQGFCLGTLCEFYENLDLIYSYY
ncbi:hypothetical protein OSTOST_25605, partial [Ostertagia ostertagi]